MPRFLEQWIGFYHEWLARLRSRQTASVLWQLTGKRFVQVGVAMLFVSALLLFVTPAYLKVKAVVEEDWLFPNGLPLVFWSAFGLVLLGPLIAIWRNVSALSMILAEAATIGVKRQKRLRPLLETALRVVGLSDRMQHYPRQLSGGQQQRVAIARAIVADPTFLLCDEPTGDLDRKSASEILDLMDVLVHEHKKTILMVTHDPKAAERADLIPHLDKGVLVEAEASATPRP